MYLDLSRLILLGRLFQEYSVSILAVVIYYIFSSTICFCLPHLTVAGGEAGFSLGCYKLPTYAMQLLHGGPAILRVPLVGSLALLITDVPVKWLDLCCSEAVKSLMCFIYNYVDYLF